MLLKTLIVAITITMLQISALPPGKMTLSDQMLVAVKSGDSNKVMALIRLGADVNARANDGSTALILASGEGNIEIAQVLLNHGAAINARLDSLPHDVTPLMCASQHGHLSMVKFLVKNHANVKTFTNNGETALLFASSYEIAKALIGAGADINAVTSGEAGNTTVLMSAVIRNRLDIVKLLLAKRVRLNDINTQGETALGIATKSQFNSMVRILKKCHAVSKLGWK